VKQGDINRRVSSVGLPTQILQGQVAQSSLAAGQPYAGIDALLQRLGSFTGQGSQPQMVATPQRQPELTSGQIIGSAIQSAGSMIGDYMTTNALLKSLNRGGGVGTDGFTRDTRPYPELSGIDFSNNSIFG